MRLDLASLVKELLKNPKKLEELTAPQLTAVLAQLKPLATEMGLASASIPDNPASFAEKFSLGTRTPWVRAPHLDYLNDRLLDLASGKKPRLIVTMPPRHGKSEFASYYFPLWFLGKNPKARIVIASYSHDFSEGFGRRLRDFVRDRGEELGLRLDPSTTAAHRWNLLSGGTVTTVGRGGPLTGRGADLLIIDDPIKDELEASSPLIRQRLWDWWQTTASTRLEPGAVCVVIQTRWHFDDLAGRLEAQSKAGDAMPWEVVNLPALAVGDLDPLGRAEGDPLWPTRYPVEALGLIKKGLSPYHWSSLYQQSPIPAEGGLFKLEWWKYYDVLPDDMDLVIQSWDLSFKDLKKSDYTVGQVWGRKGASFYLIDQIREHMNAKDVIEAIRAFAKKYPKARAKLIEDKANGPAVIALLNREVSGIIPVQVRASKASRAQAIVPYLQAGNVYLPKNAPWASDLILEAAQFPMAAHDDQVDTLTQALNYLAPGGWATVDRIHKGALGEDFARGRNPRATLQEGIWKELRSQEKESREKGEEDRLGQVIRPTRIWNA